MRSYHQLSILVLHQGGDSVDPCSKDRWPLGGDVAFAGSFLLSSGQQPLLLLWAFVSSVVKLRTLPRLEGLLALALCELAWQRVTGLGFSSRALS